MSDRAKDIVMVLLLVSAAAAVFGLPIWAVHRLSAPRRERERQAAARCYATQCPPGQAPKLLNTKGWRGPECFCVVHGWR